MSQLSQISGTQRLRASWIQWSSDSVQKTGQERQWPKSWEPRYHSLLLLMHTLRLKISKQRWKPVSATFPYLLPSKHSDVLLEMFNMRCQIRSMRAVHQGFLLHRFPCHLRTQRETPHAYEGQPGFRSAYASMLLRETLTGKLARTAGMITH